MDPHANLGLLSLTFKTALILPDVAVYCKFFVIFNPHKYFITISQSVLVLGPNCAWNSLVGGGGGTVKIASAPGPDHLILNWNRLE